MSQAPSRPQTGYQSLPGHCSRLSFPGPMAVRSRFSGHGAHGGPQWGDLGALLQDLYQGNEDSGKDVWGPVQGSITGAVPGKKDSGERFGGREGCEGDPPIVLPASVAKLSLFQSRSGGGPGAAESRGPGSGPNLLQWSGSFSSHFFDCSTTPSSLFS